MIQAVMVINTQGKPRLAKFYDVQVWPLSLNDSLSVICMLSFSCNLADNRPSYTKSVSAGSGEAAGAYTKRLWRFSLYHI